MGDLPLWPALVFLLYVWARRRGHKKGRLTGRLDQVQTRTGDPRGMSQGWR